MSAIMNDPETSDIIRRKVAEGKSDMRVIHNLRNRWSNEFVPV